MTKKELFSDIRKHLIEDEKPSAYLREIYHNALFSEPPFDKLKKLKSTEQSPIHHPEGNVWNHTMLVVDEAASVKAKSKNPAVFMWAALLHDIGKPATTRQNKGKITSYNHDRVGAALAREFLSELTDEHDFIKEVCGLVKYHMHILYVVNNLPFADIKGMKQSTDINDIALLGLCDRLGRTNADRKKEEATVQLFLKKCKQKTAQTVLHPKS